MSTVQGLLDYQALYWTYFELGTDAEMPKLTEYLHTAAAADYIGVAQNTLRKWAARGEIPVHRNPANGYRLFKRMDLDKFLTMIEKPASASARSKPK